MSQRQFSEALLDPAAPVPAGLSNTLAGGIEQRFAVHRNNTVVSLVDALQATYPVISELVGEPFFRAMAAVYVRQSPPRHPVLWRYGLDFDRFLRGFEPVSGLPYLPAVARVEAACALSLNAADDSPMNAAHMAQLMADGDTLALRGCRFAASVMPLALDRAGADIWMAHQPGTAMALETLDTDRSQEVLVYRRDDGAQAGVVVWEPPSGTVALVCALMADATWLRAAQSVAATHGRFDLVTSLGGLIHHGLVVNLPLQTH